MRVCYWPLDCLSESSPAHQPPCPLKLEDARPASCNPSPVSIVLEKESSGNEKGFEVLRNGLDDDDDGGGKVVEVLPKSSMKKPAGYSANGASKGRVKWMDFVGKELVEIREFEPLESRETEQETDDCGLSTMRRNVARNIRGCLDLRDSWLILK